MKTFFILLITLSFSAIAEVSLQDCFDDATTYGNHERSVAPLPECASVIDAEVDKVELVSGGHRIFGKGNMIYVDKRDANGIILERALLAGDQTELSGISKFFVDTLSNRLFVIQKRALDSELLVFNLGFLGNVTPLNLMRSSILFSTALLVKPAEVAGKLEVTNDQGVFLINANAESRSSRSVRRDIASTPK